MGEWRQSKKYEDYELSTEGQVRNIRTGRILKKSVNKKGYEQVSLRKDNRACTESIHRLMADTYFEGELDGRDVYHKNLNRSDNRLSNLEICSKSETCKRGFREGKRTGRGQIRVRVKKKNQDGSYYVIGEFDSFRECARFLNVNVTVVSRCANNLIKTCRGYIIEKC